MSVSLCLPAGHSGAPWTELRAAPREPHQAPRVAGLDDGYVSRDGRSGIVVFDVSPEADRQRCSAQIGGLLMASAAATLQGRVLVAAVYGPPQLFARTRDADAPVAGSLLGSVSSWEGPTYGCSQA